ncbi:MAG: TRAP transporter substrate-binding protein DctP [Ideonella sp.]|nr:TRAP transporter substrate-binding protein DctP [Ideonella sp.]MCC7458876.1 TRAP transporter substrate-binding protein DctP [Nitrospira sp.]
MTATPHGRRSAARRLVLAALLAAASAAWPADATMRISHQFPPAHHSAKNLEQFAADVKAATQGKVEVQIFGSAQLFKPNQNHAAVATGKIEAAAIVGFTLGGTIPEMNVTLIPYYVTAADKVRKFPGSPAARMLDAKLLDKGLLNLGWMVDASDGIFTSAKAPLVQPADFKGIKIRGLSKLFDEGLIAMGAAPSAMPGSEVYQALQTGVIDAGFTGVAAAYERKYYEVQKFGVASNIILAHDVLVVNPAWFNALPAEFRQAIQAAAHKAELRSIPKTAGIAADDVKNLRDKGMTVTVLTPEQEKAIAAAMQPAVLKAFKASSPDAQKLIDLVDRL